MIRRRSSRTRRPGIRSWADALDHDVPRRQTAPRPRRAHARSPPYRMHDRAGDVDHRRLDLAWTAAAKYRGKFETPEVTRRGPSTVCARPSRERPDDQGSRNPERPPTELDGHRAVLRGDPANLEKARAAGEQSLSGVRPASGERNVPTGRPAIIRAGMRCSSGERAERKIQAVGYRTFLRTLVDQAVLAARSRLENRFGSIRRRCTAKACVDVSDLDIGPARKFACATASWAHD